MLDDPQVLGGLAADVVDPLDVGDRHDPVHACRGSRLQRCLGGGAERALVGAVDVVDADVGVAALLEPRLGDGLRDALDPKDR